MKLTKRQKRIIAAAEAAETVQPPIGDILAEVFELKNAIIALAITHAAFRSETPTEDPPASPPDSPEPKP